MSSLARASCFLGTAIVPERFAAGAVRERPKTRKLSEAPRFNRRGVFFLRAVSGPFWQVLEAESGCLVQRGGRSPRSGTGRALAKRTLDERESQSLSRGCGVFVPASASPRRQERGSGRGPEILLPFAGRRRSIRRTAFRVIAPREAFWESVRGASRPHNTHGDRKK